MIIKYSYINHLYNIICHLSFEILPMNPKTTPFLREKNSEKGQQPNSIPIDEQLNKSYGLSYTAGIRNTQKSQKKFRFLSNLLPY